MSHPTPPVAPRPADAANKTPETPANSNGLGTSFLSQPMNLAPEADLIKASAPRNTRSDEQKAMDKVVSDYHKKWIAEGKPTQWPTLASKKCVATYVVEPSDVTKIKQYVNRATALHDVRARYGSQVTVTESMLKKYGMPDNYLGRQVVTFAIMDKRPRDVDPKVAAAAVEKAKQTREAKRAAK